LNAAIRNNYAAFLAMDDEPLYKEAYDELRETQILVSHPIIEENIEEVKKRL
jgi:hypothetical protein